MMSTISLKLGNVTPALFGHVIFKIISGVYTLFPPSTIAVNLMVKSWTALVSTVTVLQPTEVSDIDGQLG